MAGIPNNLTLTIRRFKKKKKGFRVVQKKRNVFSLSSTTAIHGPRQKKQPCCQGGRGMLNLSPVNHSDTRHFGALVCVNAEGGGQRFPVCYTTSLCCMSSWRGENM